MPQAQLPHLSMPDNAFSRVLPQAVEQAVQVVDKYTDLKDYQLQLDKTRELKKNEMAFKSELRRRADLPWGSQDSIYMPDGRLNRETVQSVVSMYQEKNLALRGGFWKRQNNVRGDEAVNSANEFMQLDAFEMLGQQERQNMLSVFQNSFDMMEAGNDVPGAFAVADSGVEKGLISWQQGEAMKRRIATRAVQDKARETRRLNVGGTEFVGMDARLAAAKARQDGKPAEGQEEFSLDEEGGTDGGAATGLFPEDDAVATSAADQWWAGDDGAEIKIMTPSEAAGVQSALDQPCEIASELKPDGSVGFRVSASADNVVRAQVAQADAVGELTEDGIAMIVEQVALATAADNPKATVSNVKQNFKNAGLYAKLGGGNSDVGEVRAEAIIQRTLDGYKVSTGRLATPHIEQMVTETLKTRGIPSAGGWTDIPKLKPILKDGKYKCPADAYGRTKWEALERMYKKDRAVFNPWAIANKVEYSQKEFEENAQAYYDDLTREGGRYDQLKASYTENAKAWYMSQIMLELAEHSTGLRNGAVTFDSGYAHEVDLVNDVLRREVPLDLSISAAARLDALNRQRLAKVAEKDNAIRKKAEPYYAKLNVAYGQASPEAQKAHAAEEKAAKAEDAQKLREAKERQNLEYEMERRTPKQASWTWNEQQTDDYLGAELECSVPKSVLEQLAKAGYDGTKIPYLRVGKAALRITGTHEGEGLKLNTPAVFAIQGKLKKGQEPIVSGKLQYTIIFK